MPRTLERWLGWWLPLALFVGCARTDAGRETSPVRAMLPGLPARAEVRAVPPSPVERGRYLVHHVAECVDCHSPRVEPHGRFDEARALAGLDCFIDVVPADPSAGCLATANLTNHESGLKNRTDAQIKTMIVDGVRPDGRALHPFMPYRFFGNMRGADVDAIVAYLRTVPGVDHTVGRSQAPFLAPKQPAPRVPEAVIPEPRADYADREAALRGRYLAGNVGSCLNCHTERAPEGPNFERAFQGGMKFDSAQLGLSAEYPPLVYSANLTPHATGLAGYSVADIVRALKHGVNKRQPGHRLCPPMPAGPVDAFGGLTDADASDIAHYLRSLPAGDHALPACRPNAPENKTNGGTATNGELPAKARGETTRNEPPFDPRRFTQSDLKLSAVGLYTEVRKRAVADGWREYEPAFSLYSDGEVKRRWLHLPDGARIDNQDPDHWQFPVGTLAAKEFSRDGRRIETRLIVRTGPGANDFFMGAFLWDDDEADARLVTAGAVDARGTDHDVPSSSRCWSCHGGEPGRILGFSAVQQPNVDAALLRTAPTAPFTPPGDRITRAALGYLHANCAHCHNPSGSARPDSDMDLRLAVGDREAIATQAYRTTLGRPLQAFGAEIGVLRVAVGDPAHSALLLRMQQRGNDAQMPPLGSEHVDAAGVALVRRWIGGL